MRRREIEEFRINIEKLDWPTDHADTIANHAFGDGVAVEEQERDRTFPDRCGLSVRGKAARRQKHSMIVVALNRPAKFVDLRSAHWISAPALRLECRADTDYALTKQSVTIDTPISATVCNLQLLVTKRTK